MIRDCSVGCIITARFVRYSRKSFVPLLMFSSAFVTLIGTQTRKKSSKYFSVANDYFLVLYFQGFLETFGKLTLGRFLGEIGMMKRDTEGSGFRFPRRAQERRPV